MTTVAVAGSVAQRFGRAGHAWVFLHYVLGLRRLGHDVVFLDRLDEDMTTDELGVTRPTVDLVAWLLDTFAAVGAADSLALRVDGGRTWVGLGEREVRARLRDAVLIDVMGFLGDDPVADHVAGRVFVDLDPGFTQIWHDLGLHEVAPDYDRYISVGTALGDPACPVPTLGLPWTTSLPPVVLEQWPVATAAETPVTSVAAWRGLTAPIRWRGQDLGVRAHSLRPYREVPAHAGGRFELCLDIHPADAGDAERLRTGGWHLLAPLDHVSTPHDYRRFVASSAAELSVGKHLHTRLRTGWFSDRSAVYLASGRPVAALDTGVVGLPAGDGFVTFDDPAGAVAAIGALRADPDRHAAAARRLAEQHLDSDLVLPRWIEGVPR